MIRTVEHCGKARTVEVKRGPFKMFANDERDYFEGFVLPEPLDPYGEPYLIVFTNERIVQ